MLAPALSPDKKKLLKVGMFIQPRLRSMVNNPLKSSPKVLVCSRDRVLRSFPVVDRNSNNISFSYESVEVAVVLGSEW